MGRDIPPPAAAGTRDRHPLLWPALASMIIAQALVVLASLAVPIMGPRLAAALAVSPGLIGAYSAIMFCGAMFAALLTPALVARFGSVRVSQATLVLAGLGLLIAVVPSPWSLAPSALALGLAYGPANPASSAVLRRVTTAKNRGRVFSVKQTSVPIGGAIAGIALPWLDLHAGWTAVVLVAAGLAFAAALLLQPWRGALDTGLGSQLRLPGARLLLAPLRFVLRDPELRQIGWMSCALAGVQFTYSAACVTILVALGGLSLPMAGLALSTAMVTGFVIRIVSGYGADRFGGTAVLMAFALLMLAGSAAMMAMTPAWPAWLSFAAALLLGSGGLSWNGVYLAEVAARTSEADVAVATAGCMVMTFLGGLAGPALFALVALATGSMRIPTAVMAVLAAWALTAVLRLRAGDRARARSAGGPRC